MSYGFTLIADYLGIRYASVDHTLYAITNADVSEIRLMMDALLEVWIGKLILFSSS